MNLGQTPIPEDQYKADLELLDRYQNYSAEIIRLSLLGIAGLAFFLVQLVSSEKAPAEFKDSIAGILIGISALLFIFAAGCALSHRYHSTDGLFYHFKALRLANHSPPEHEKANEMAKRRNKRYAASGGWLVAAVGLFGAGGFLFVAGFSRIIFLWFLSS